ncbi:MAG: galactokinase [Clostridia bacterium]|nr:galactokinase [Clostridia bacterium]
MKISEIKKLIADGGLDAKFAELYSNTAIARNRYLSACDGFADNFGTDREVYLFSAPGRTEVGGNHTDHQHGRVLAGSVDLDVIAVVAAADGNVIRVKSEGYDMDTVKFDMLSPRTCENGRSSALIRGMCAMSRKAGYNIGAFDAYTTSNVLKGSGLSSSAAFEVLIGVILNYMFNDGAIDAVTIAKFAQASEREFFGKPCGLMDQMASSVGGFTAIDFADPQNPVIEKVTFDLAANNHALCIVNTGGNHTDLTDDYADITVECARVSEFFDKKFLRDVDESDFFANIAALREKVGDRAILRALHFFADNKRALDEKVALQNGDFCEFLSLIRKSGDSSYKYLQNVFSTSNVGEQGISLALALTDKYLGERGAYRVHGGGFAGTIQAFVPLDMLDGYIDVIESAFGKGNCYVLKIRPVGGTKIL